MIRARKDVSSVASSMWVSARKDVCSDPGSMWVCETNSICSVAWSMCVCAREDVSSVKRSSCVSALCIAVFYQPDTFEEPPIVGGWSSIFPDWNGTTGRYMYNIYIFILLTYRLFWTVSHMADYPKLPNKRWGFAATRCGGLEHDFLTWPSVSLYIYPNIPKPKRDGKLC